MTSSSTASYAALQDRSLASAPKPHPKLWFPDGNIVLATYSFVFRIHKGILAARSSVFKDMFEFFTPLHEDVPTQYTSSSNFAGSNHWDGVPIVRMAGDSDEDVICLLSALYERRFFRIFEVTSASTICCLLRMSTKYDFSDLRDEVVRTLQRPFPNCFAEFRRRSLFRNSFPFQDEHHFQILAIAHRFHIKILLPVLYYLCAVRDNETRTTMGRRYLSHEVMRTIEEGRSKMIEDINTFTTPPSDYGSRENRRCLRRYDRCKYDRKIFYLSEFYYCCGKTGELKTPLNKMSKNNKDYCGRCCQLGELDRVQARKDFWSRLPSYFGLPGWETLRTEVGIFADLGLELFCFS